MVGTNEPTLQEDGKGNPIQGALRPIKAQRVALTNVTERSAEINSKIVKVHCDVACFLQFGGSDITTAESAGAINTLVKYVYALPAGQVEYFNLGDLQYIAGILNTGTGTLEISEMG